LSKAWVCFSAKPITPKDVNQPLAGYIERVGRAVGVHDDIYLRLLALESGDACLALVSLDLLGVDEYMASDIEKLSKILGRCTVIAAATHTHSAPATLFRNPLLSMGARFDPEYYSQFVETAKESFEECSSTWSELKRAEVYEVSIRGVATDRNNPSRTIDDRATLILFRSASGDYAILNYAMHPTVLGPENNLISRDLAGAAVDLVERLLNVKTLFINGAAANISTRFTRRSRTFEEVYRLGKLLAEQVAEVVRSGSGHVINTASISAESRRFSFRVAPKSELKRRAEEVYRKYRGASERVPQLEAAEFLNAVLDLLPSSIEASVVKASMGDLKLYTWPGELHSDVSLSLRRRLGSGVLALACYANGYIGYVSADEGELYESLMQVVLEEDVRKALGFLFEL